MLRALNGDKKLLLLEEPWSGLDSKSTERLKAYLLSKDIDATIIVVSNDPEYNAKTDQQITFKNGKI